MKNFYLPLVSLCMITAASWSCTSTETTPEIIETWKPWVAERLLKDTEKDTLFNRFVNDRYDQGGLGLNYSQSYVDDESGDAQYAESKAYITLSQQVLCSIKIVNNENLEADIREAIDDLTQSGWYSSAHQKMLEQQGWDPSAAGYWSNYIQQHQEVAFQNVVKFYNNLSELHSRLARTVELIEWSLDNHTDKYKIYDAVYFVNNREYASCRILERDNGQSEVEIVSHSDRLLRLQKPQN